MYRYDYKLRVLVSSQIGWKETPYRVENDPLFLFSLQVKQSGEWETLFDLECSTRFQFSMWLKETLAKAQPANAEEKELYRQTVLYIERTHVPGNM
jgi:hypothetical protein